MTRLIVKGCEAGATGVLRGSVGVPGDKSISHRALMLAALGEGMSRVEGFLPSGDCLATLDCVRRLGAEVDHDDVDRPTTLVIHGRGLRGLVPPKAPLNCRRSGTSMRLLSGILSGQVFDSVLTGESQLLSRPMRRITMPLRQMGAAIQDTDGHGPLSVTGSGPLKGSGHVLSVASAQVKSAILLAGLYADGPVTVNLPGPARDHTERMLAAQIVPHSGQMGAITYDAVSARLDPGAVDHLNPLNCVVPGDFSSAAFILAAALTIAGSEVTVLGVGVNPTRTGFLDVLQAMGAAVALGNLRDQGGEPVADVTVRANPLVASEIGGDTVVRMIDEFPILAVLATQAAGRTTVRDAAELRVKETDRIASVVTELGKLGAHIEPLADGFVVEGPTPLLGAEVDSQGDHRLGMALAVAGMIAGGETTVLGADCIPDSFPGFTETICAVGGAVRHDE